MASAVQWTVDRFWSELQALKSGIDAASSALEQNRTELAGMYARARAAYDPARDAYLAPLIHRNTTLRITYLKPIRAKYNQAVNAAGAAIRRAGYTTPGLAGLGLAPAIIVPAVAVAAVVVALAAVAVVNRMTQAQITRTNTMARIMNGGGTAAEKLALAKAITDSANAESRANPPLLDFGALALPLALVAAIVIVPRLLPARRATA